MAENTSDQVAIELATAPGVERPLLINSNKFKYKWHLMCLSIFIFPGILSIILTLPTYGGNLNSLCNYGAPQNITNVTTCVCYRYYFLDNNGKCTIEAKSWLTASLCHGFFGLFGISYIYVNDPTVNYNLLVCTYVLIIPFVGFGLLAVCAGYYRRNIYPENSTRNDLLTAFLCPVCISIIFVDCFMWLEYAAFLWGTNSTYIFSKLAH